MKMGHWNFHVVVLLPILGVFSHFAHDKIDLNVEQDVGGNNLFRETPDKYIEAAAELVESIDMDMLGDKMDLSSFPPNSADYQNLLSDEHSAAYGRHKRDTKDVTPATFKKKQHRRHRKNHRGNKKNVVGATSPKDIPKASRRDSSHRRRHNRVLTKVLEIPKDLYQSHLRPGVIFRIHMAEALNKLMFRNYANDQDESVVEADVEYLRLTRKVLVDEITKFEDLRWLMEWNLNRTRLVVDHICSNRYFFMGAPPSIWSTLTEDMKRYCLFDGLYIDNVPYVIGDDGGIMAAVAPPVLHCDAATCTAVPFIDAYMFDSTLPPTNVRTVTKCQADCRKQCKNDPHCLNECIEGCKFVVIKNTETPIPPFAYMPRHGLNMGV